MGSYYVDLDTDRADEAEAFSRPRRAGKSHGFQGGGSHYYPETDEAARELITKLNHFVWETRKVSGTFSSNPYTIVATIGGATHTIHLPGRFGSTLSWLKQKRDS